MMGYHACVLLVMKLILTTQGVNDMVDPETFVFSKVQKLNMGLCNNDNTGSLKFMF